jgi:hypothetical protein
MAHKIQIPGSVNNEQPTNIIPPVHTMVETIFRQMPEFAEGINRLAYMVHMLQQQLGALQMAQLEHIYLLNHAVKALNVTVPNMLEIRQEIKHDRLEFLKAVLEKDESLSPEKKEGLAAQIKELEADLNSNTEPEKTAEPNVDSQ